METLFEIALDHGGSPRARTRDLSAQLKAAILDGRLRPGTRLPPTRKAPQVFGVSRNTAAAIYERLLSAGYIVMRQGAGTFVAEALPRVPEATRAQRESPPTFRLNEFWLRSGVTDAMGFWRDRATATTNRQRDAIDFRPGLVDPRLFPFDVFRRVSSRQLRELERKPAAFKSPQGNQGTYTLRKAITEHIALTRAVVCRPDDVLVTSGAQQAFDLLARVLITPNKTVVAVEDPGYPPLRVAFEAVGARVVPVPVDDEGLVVDRIPRNVGVICVAPSHQFPLGVTMSVRRRKALVAFARAHGAVIVEDDYDGEFRYAGGAMEALRTAEAADVVFYVGTFSKCMLPALRLGFLVAPSWAMPTLVSAKNCLDWHCSTPVQLGVADFIAEGHLSRHVRKLRQIYRQRRQALMKGVERRLGSWLDLVPSFYGMHVAAVARRKLDGEAIASWLDARNVKLHALDRYFIGSKRQQGFVLGYGAVDVEQIGAGIEALRQALAKR